MLYLHKRSKYKREMKKIIIFCILVITIYIGFKFYCYNVYGPEKSLEIPSIKINGNMTINHIDLNEDEYITFSNMKFKNVFEGYEKLNEESDTYKMTFTNEKGERKAIFIGSDNQYVYMINNSEEYKSLSNSIIKKENIKDDVEFLEYLEKHNDDKVKFFMTTRRQKQIHYVNEFKTSVLPSIEYVKEIDGYYRGYIYKTAKNIYEVNILNGDKKYYFTFIGEYTEKFINDFMNSVIIK